jgi:flagellar biosynthesis protein FlhB
MADEDKSQRATPKRREKARERGQVVRSRELPSALGLLAVAALVRFGNQGWIPVWRDLFRHLLDDSSRGDMTAITPLVHLTAWNVVRWAAPPLALAWSISMMGYLAQGGFVFSPQALQLTGARLNVANNVGRIFSAAGLSPLLKSLVPLGVLIYLGVSILARDWLLLLHSLQMGLPLQMHWLANLIYEFSWKAGLVLLCWSGADYGLQKWSYEHSLRMSKQEIRDEHKDLEGNPQTRTRIRRRRREMRRRQMLQQVARATVVIANPDEFAVALEYKPDSMAAPLVVAKGRGLLAQKIKREARWYEIPIVENVPLARALYRTVEIGGTIPSKLYTAVAEVLAFIYRAQAQARSRAEREAKEKKAAATPSSLG